ncbi:MAG: hypothetical protein V4603_11010 [Pseudomonadota bacterium]
MRRIAITLLSAAILGAMPAVFAQADKSQAGGLPALAQEVAALRALVAQLQEQVGGNADPYTGTFAVTLVETSMFGCGVSDFPPPPPTSLQPYLARQAASSLSVRSASFDVEANGTVLLVPAFELLTQELKLSGKYATDTRIEGSEAIVIAGDGSLYADLGDSEVTGQIANDGSMFSAVVRGRSLDEPPGTCEDVWTVNLTGVRK